MANGMLFESNRLGPWDQLPRPKHRHPCFPIPKGKLPRLSRGNLAHSARVTRPTKAAMPSGHQHRLPPGGVSLVL